MVVFISPFVQHIARLVKAQVQLTAEQFITQFAVVRFHVAVAHGLALAM